MKKTLVIMILILAGCVDSVDNNKIIELENKVKHLTTNTLVSRYEDGNLVYEENYIDNQKIVKHFLYKSNKLDSIVTYDAQGNILYKELYSIDKKYFYDKSKNIIYCEEYSYNNDTRTLNKSLTYYNDFGEITKKETFFNDKLINLTMYDDGKKVLMELYEKDQMIYKEYYNANGSKEYAEWYKNQVKVHDMRLLSTLNDDTYKHSYYIDNSLVREEIVNLNNNTKEIFKYNDGILVSKEIFQDNRLTFKSIYETMNDEKIITNREYGIYLQKEQVEYYYEDVINKIVIKYYDLGKLADSNITFYSEGIKTRIDYYNEYNDLILSYFFDIDGNITSTEEYDT